MKSMISKILIFVVLITMCLLPGCKFWDKLMGKSDEIKSSVESTSEDAYTEVIDSKGGTIYLAEYGSVTFEKGQFYSPTLVKVEVKQNTESTILGSEPMGPWIEISLSEQTNQKATGKNRNKSNLINPLFVISFQIKLYKKLFPSSYAKMEAVVIKGFENFFATGLDTISPAMSSLSTIFYRLKNGLQESEDFWTIYMNIPNPVTLNTAIAVTLVNTANSPEYLPPTLQKIAGIGSKAIILLHGLVGMEVVEGGEDAYKGWGPGGCWQSLVSAIGETSLLEKYTLYCYKYPTYKSAKVNGDSLVSKINLDSDLKDKGNDSITLIAHSMGGLVGRYAMNTNKFGDKVNTIITLATPHHGSPGPSYLEAKPEVVYDDNISAFHYWILKGALWGRYPITDGIKSLYWDNYDEKLINTYKYGIGINDYSNVINLFSFNKNDSYKNKLICLMGNCPTLDGKLLFGTLDKDSVRQAAEDINDAYDNYDLLVPGVSGIFSGANLTLISGSLEIGGYKLYSESGGGIDHEEIFREPRVISDIITYLETEAINNPPNTPSITSPTSGQPDIATNPSITGSAFIDPDGGDNHQKSDWEIYDNAGLDSGNRVWYKSGDTANKTNITVNSSNGTFENALAPQSELGNSTDYWVRVKYYDDNGSASNWSGVIQFKITAVPNTAPTISIVQPNGVGDTADTTFTITWTDSDPDNDATITLYYDTNNTPGGEIQIVTGLIEGTDVSYVWNASSPTPITGVVNNNYYIRAKIDDGVNGAVWAYSDGAVTINHVSNQPPIVTNVSPVGDNGDIAITYDLADADGDTCSIAVKYQGGSVDTTWTAATTTGTKTGITPGVGKTITWNSATDESFQRASDYKIRITPNDGTTDGTLGESAAFFVDNNVDPTIAIVQPDGVDDTADTTYTITWTDFDSDTDATISLYYDIDTMPGGEVLIVSGLSENADGTNGSYTWDASSPTPITGVVNDNYYIRAKIDDSVNGAVWAYSGGPVTIDHGGENWTEATSSAAFGARYVHTSIVFENKMWVIGGFDGGYNGDSRNDVWHSSNGMSWTQATNSAAFSPRYRHTTVVFENKMWVIGGSSGNYKNDVWYSSNGVIWTQATNSAAFSARSGHTSVVFEDKMWVIGGNDGDYDDYRNDVWHSSNGVIWTQATNSAAFDVRANHTSVVFEDKMWVIGGGTGGSYGGKNDVWHSSNGVIWTQATNSAAFNARDDHTSVVFEDKMWVIGGCYGFNAKNDVWHSSNGVIWTQATNSAAFNVRDGHTSVVFEDKMWVIGGTMGYPDAKNDVWYSE